MEMDYTRFGRQLSIQIDRRHFSLLTDQSKRRQSRGRRSASDPALLSHHPSADIKWIGDSDLISEG
jgi:hypothetical protein